MYVGEKGRGRREERKEERTGNREERREGGNGRREDRRREGKEREKRGGRERSYEWVCLFGSDFFAVMEGLRKDKESGGEGMLRHKGIE